MSGIEKNFSQWEPGDNQADLSEGLLRRLAGDLGIELPEVPGPDDYQKLVGILGKNRVLQDNEEVQALSTDQMAKYLADTGMQEVMDRSVLNPDMSTISADPNTFVLQAGMANWQDRMTRVLLGRDTGGKRVITLAGNRVMNTGTEVSNEGVARLHGAFDRYPKESEFMGSIVVPKLVVAGYEVLPMSFDTNDGDVIFDALFAQNPNLLEERIAVVRVANAGLLMALQLRQAGRRVSSEYDNDPSNPQVFALTDHFPVADDEEKSRDPKHYQKPQTGLRQVVLTAKKIAEEFPL